MGGNITADYIKGELQQILNINHTNPHKKKIVESNKSIDCACPVCGDSQKNQYLKRMNVFKNSLHVECWNCGYKSSFIGLLKHFNIQINYEMKSILLDYVEDNIQKIKWYEDQFVVKTLDKMIPIGDLEKYCNQSSSSKLKEFKPIQKGSKVYNYLISRQITDFTNMYQAVFYRSPNWKEDVMVSINGGDDRVLGIQLRNLQQDRIKRMYKNIFFL